MSALTDAREVLANAVSLAGLECTPYAPDSLSPPAAFVDTVTIDYDLAQSFCMDGLATASVVACAQRNDRAGAMFGLESLVPVIVGGLVGVDGVRVLSVDSGSTEIGGASLPAVIFSVQFGLREE